MNAFLLPKSPTPPRLSLHQLTALDATPVELIAMASALGCAHVCLFTQVPEVARHVYPMVTAIQVPMVADALAQAGVTLCNLEVFSISQLADIAALRGGLEVGAALGATRATAHIHGLDGAAAIGAFAAFCDMAQEYGIIAGLEFNAFSAVPTAPAAAAIVTAAGRPNGAVVLDLLHLVRSGGSAADVAAMARLIGYVQICDGPLSQAADQRWREAVGERLLPGDGAFPLVDLLCAVHHDVVIEVEVPQTAARKAGVSAFERASRAVAASRSVIALAEQSGAWQ